MAPSLKDKLALIRAEMSLQETEDSWEKVCKSIVSFSEFIRGSSGNHPQEIITTARELHRPITSAMKSERTRLSGPAIDLVSTMASELGTDFEPLLHLFFPTLLLLCARTSKVVINRARSCIISLIETTQLLSIIPYFIQSIRDKSVSLRTVTAEGTLACLNSFNPPDLAKEERTKEIEALIKVSIRDANAEVRKIGKQIYLAYELLLPAKAESFAAPLTPTSKKYLGLGSRPHSALELGGHSRLPPQMASSSSRGADIKMQPKQLLKKKSSPHLPTSTHAPTSRPRPISDLQLTTTHSTHGLRPNSAMDAPVRPTRENRSRAHSPPHAPVRPLLSRSESAATSAGHLRSNSSNLLALSTSSKPTTVAAPQRILVTSPPDVPPPTKNNRSGPIRVDPRAGRDPTGYPKPNKVTSSESTTHGGGESNRARPEESLNNSKESSLRSTKPLNPPQKSQAPHSKDVVKKDPTTQTTAVTSEDKKLPHYAQPVASSRARTVSALTSSNATTRPTASRTRTIPTSTSTGNLRGAKNPPATRARTISSSAASSSAAAVAVARASNTQSSTFTDINRLGTSSKGASKPTWGSSRSVAPVNSKRAAKSDPSKASASITKKNEKQKRPSVVHEELDEILVTPQGGADSREEISQNEEHDEGTGHSSESPTRANENMKSSTEEETEEVVTSEELHQIESSLAVQETEASAECVATQSDGKDRSLRTNFEHNTSQMESSSKVVSPTDDTPVEVKILSNTPSLPKTPVQRLSHQSVEQNNLFVQVEATPISALLTSIQRGFLYTPATPLSPPDSYLPKESDGVIMPFPLFSNQTAQVKHAGSNELHEHSDSLDCKTRPALETVDMNWS
ncbi:clasp N terminal-domain-containing protein [Lentinula raphanica]|nr:clasp N terminal-domain-containing protein [Lentinula raphanica]